jgi:hypothetical protein
MSPALESRVALAKKYKRALYWPNRDSSLELLIQELENVLSQDFKNMGLAELKVAEQMFYAIAGMREHRETIYLSESQRKARDFLWYRIRQEENKDDFIKIGDLFVSSWGYEQTNVDLFKVVGFTKSKKSAIIRQIGFDTKKGSEGFMSDSVIPDPDFEIKAQEWSDKEQRWIDTKEHKPDLRVKIEREHERNPYTGKADQIGAKQLRGSVYYGTHGDGKHLETLRRIKKGASTYRSWYA